MMKIVISITLSLLLLASAIMATDTRVMTMGDNNTIMLDEANIWLYPSRINYYPDLAEIELAHHEFQYAIQPKDKVGAGLESSGIERIGVNLKFGGDNPYVIGLYLHDRNGFTNQFLPSELTVIPTSNKQLELLYGRKFGDYNFGMSYGFIHSSYEALMSAGPDSYDSRSFTQHTIEGGITYQDKLDLMIGLELFSFTDMESVDLAQDLNDSIGYPKDENWTGVDNYESDGNSRFYFNARYFHELNPTVTVVPHIDFSTGVYKNNNYDWMPNSSPDSGWANRLDETRKTTSTEFTIGSGMHYTPSSKVLVVIDFGLTTNKTDLDRTDIITRDAHYNATEILTYIKSDQWTSLPFIKLGFEADVFRWMDVRFGAETYWTDYTYENSADEEKYSVEYPDNRNYLGFGFHWGQFHVDTYANPELFLNGFNFIAGNSTDQMNLKISAVYEMR